MWTSNFFFFFLVMTILCSVQKEKTPPIFVHIHVVHPPGLRTEFGIRSDSGGEVSENKKFVPYWAVANGRSYLMVECIFQGLIRLQCWGVRADDRSETLRW